MLETLEGTFNAAGTLTLHEGTTVKGVFQLIFNRHLETDFAEITPLLTGNCKCQVTFFLFSKMESYSRPSDDFLSIGNLSYLTD